MIELGTSRKSLIYGSLTLSAACLGFLYKTYRIYQLRERYEHIPGPPSDGLLGFYFGNLESVVKAMKTGKILADLIHEWVNQYGPVIKFQVLDKIVVFTVEPDAVRVG
jgi:hypothetical protein